jgi:putative peptide zinc metalloprotease protein
VLSLMISQRIPLLNGHAIASLLEKRIGFVFSGIGMVYWCGLVISGLMVVGTHHEDFVDELRRMFDPSLWLLLLGMWAVAKVIHEAGHAVAARYHDVHVGKIGIMFFFMAPLAYVDVTDAWKLKSRWSRVQIALAGVYVELAVAAIAAWVWWLLPDGYARHLAAQCFLIAGPATLLVNANPLLRLDGYYVVSDLTEIPNLRMHGRRQLAGLLERLLLKIDPPRALLSGWRRKFATVHAACSVVFQVAWMGGLIIGVSMWARGLGILLALAALLLWAILPLSRWAAKVWTSEPPDRWYLNDKRKRLLCFAALLLMFIQHLCVSHSPLSRRVPIVVRFHDEQIARATADAFVESVYVTRGQRVKAGMLLLELADPELLIRRDAKADDLQIAELKAIQFRRQGELSQSAAESENAESLRRQLIELDQQIEGLDVVAARGGLVVGPQIDNLEGRFVKRGDELLRISDPQEKELLASVAETDMQAYQTAATQAVSAQVRLRGGTSFTAIPASLRPRARRSLPHPALSATVGGPLPVEPSPNENEKVRVVEPQMESLTPLDAVTSVEVRAGQIGTMAITDNRSLVTRLFDAMTR